MSRRPGRNHSSRLGEGAPSRLEVELGTTTEGHVTAEIAQRSDVHPSQIIQWKSQLMERACSVFEGNHQSSNLPVDVKVHHAKIGERH